MTSYEKIQNVLIMVLKDKYKESHYEEWSKEISPFTRLDDFSFDSLDQTEIIMDLEKELDISISAEIAMNKFRADSTIHEMTLALANLTNEKPEISQKPKTESIKQQPIIELYQLNQTTLQFRQDGKVLNLYDKKVQPYINMLRNELEKQTQK